MTKKPVPIEQLHAEYKAAQAAGNKIRMRGIQSQLVSENIMLVRKLILKYIKGLSGDMGHCEFEDLEQAGCIGMLRAFEDFQPGTSKFSTYAMFWIRREVQQTIERSMDLHKPNEKHKPHWANEAQNKIRTRTGREATAVELTEVHTAMLPEDATPARRKRATVTEAKLEAWQQTEKVFSMDETSEVPGRVSITSHYKTAGASNQLSETATLHDVTPDVSPSPERQVQNSETAKALIEGLERLPARQREIMFMAFYEQKSDVQIGAALGISRQAVQDNKNKALAKLRKQVSR